MRGYEKRKIALYGDGSDFWKGRKMRELILHDITSSEVRIFCFGLAFTRYGASKDDWWDNLHKLTWPTQTEPYSWNCTLRCLWTKNIALLSSPRQPIHESHLHRVSDHSNHTILWTTHVLTNVLQVRTPDIVEIDRWEKSTIGAITVNWNLADHKTSARRVLSFKLETPQCTSIRSVAQEEAFNVTNGNKYQLRGQEHIEHEKAKRIPWDALCFTDDRKEHTAPPQAEFLNEPTSCKSYPLTSPCPTPVRQSQTTDANRQQQKNRWMRGGNGGYN